MAAPTPLTTPQVPDPDRFLRGVPPFRNLSDGERARIAASLTLTRYGPGETILARLQPPAALHLVVDGIVEEFDPAGPIATYGPGETFDPKALIHGRSDHTFVSRGRTSCYVLPSLLFLALTRNNPHFRDYYYAELSRRLDAVVAVQQQREAASFLISRLSEGRLHPPVFVAPETTIGEANRIMQDQDITAVLTRRNGGVGIFTDRDVRERHVLMGMPVDTPIGDIASYDLRTIEAEDFLFNALVVMTKHAIRHLVVKRGEQIVGLFEQADLLRHLSNSSHVIASQVDRASTDAELKEAGAAIPRLIKSLNDRGVKPRYIARIVTELNRKVFRRVFERLTPPDLLDRVCLIVMGSEGRGEQLLRTDQDNGLIFMDTTGGGAMTETAAAFNRTLAELGYPPCPGNVMVSNPDWAKPLDAYKSDVRQWVAQPTGEAFLNLAILYDASAVAGAGTLLGELKAHIFKLIRAEEAYIGHFAKATVSFPTPLNWLNRFVVERDADHAQLIDIKKGGIFPIVHGVRSLALEYCLPETNTIARVQALSGRGPFSEEFTADLIEAFDFMSMLRLREQYMHLERNEPYSNFINIDNLSNFERSMLRDCLKVVRDLKTYIIDHFRLQLLL